jgi:protein TonB
MWNCATHIKADGNAGTGLSRFLLLSAALHLGALATLGYGTVRPVRIPPPSMSVTLTPPNGARTEPVRHRETRQASAISGRDIVAKGVERAVSAQSARPALRAAPRNTAVEFPTHVHANGDVIAGARNMPSDPPSPSAARQRETSPNEETRGPSLIRDTVPVSAQPLDTAILASRLEGQLRDALAPYFAYPMLARRNGWQGQVRIGLRVEADGRLSHVRIARSSGHRLLDNAALTTLNRINVLPRAAGWLNGRHFDMVLPIDYRLLDGQS